MDSKPLHPATMTKTIVDMRRRVQVSFSDPVNVLLQHVSAQTGLSMAQICEAAVLDQLPALVERADAVKKRAAELAGPVRKK